MKRYILLGKGGVGKTTLSAALGLALSKHRLTRVISLDPAHNLFDLFEIPSHDRSRVEIHGKLWLEEVDLGQAFRRHFETIATALKREYRYLQPLGLDTILDLLKDAPGSEEFVYLQILLETSTEDDIARIYDFPPTGLALRILSLPMRSRQWAEKLLGLRKEILELRKTIAQIRREPVSEDLVVRELFSYHAELERMITWLTSPETEYWVVTQGDPLSISEARDILIFLTKFCSGARIKLIGNRVQEGGFIRQAFQDFSEIPLWVFPQISPPPVGLKALSRFPGIQRVLEE